MNSAGGLEAVKSAVGTRIRSQRNQLGLTQENLANLAEVDRKHISSIETGKTEPGVYTLIKIAGALKTPPSQLLDNLIWVPNERGVGHLGQDEH